MKHQVIVYLGNISMIIGAAIGIYVLADVFLLSRNLPAGACPITNNRPWLILAIVFLVISIGLGFFEKKPSA